MKIKDIKEKLSGVADTVGKRKDGCIVVRRGFFYRHGNSAEAFAQNIRAHGFKVLDQGETNKPFNGGGGTAQNSHWWAVLDVSEATPA